MTEDGNKLMEEGVANQVKELSNKPDAPPAQNVALVKKYRKDFEESLGMKK